jgi:hypothetical protein
MYQKNYHFRTLLMLCMILLLSNHQLFGYENSIELERGKSKNNFTFTTSGQIKYREITIKTLKGPRSINIRSVSVSVSNSGKYAFIMLNDYNYGGTDWMIFNLETKKTILEKPSSLQNIYFKKDVIWSDFKQFGLEKYLIIPEEGDQQKEYICTNLETLEVTRIKIDFSNASECYTPLLSNNHVWLSQHEVSAFVSLLPKSGTNLSKLCPEEPTQVPWMALLDLKSKSYQIRK